MHEIGLAEGVLQVALDVTEGRPIRQVRVAIGALHAVDDASFAFAFELVSAETPAAGATVEVVPIPLRLACAGCLEERAATSTAMVCPVCGSSDVSVVGGDELSVLAVRVDDGSWRLRPDRPGPRDAVTIGETH